MLRPLLLTGFLVAQAVIPDCASSGAPGAAADQNIQAVVVNSGPADAFFNGVFTSVTVCPPGQTSGCQTIDGILVDTGSTGLRILSSVLTVSLPHQTGANGNPTAECFQFLDGFTWGPVETADIKLAGEQANSVPIQAIGTAGLPGIPAACAATGVPENTLADLGANGVLGIGLFRQDCGSACAFVGSSNPGLYYSCQASECQTTPESLTQQVQNPVWHFPTDNNGVVIQLLAVLPGGQIASTGTLTFGIGTQSNNALGPAKALTADANGNFTTVFNGTSYPATFIDSGSNAYFFLDPKTTGYALCIDASDFYCPSTTQNLSAMHRGINGVTTTFNFSVANVDPFLNSSTLTVSGEIGGPQAGSFDWGIPFFFGRTVFTAIEGQSTPAGVGPYWAY